MPSLLPDTGGTTLRTYPGLPSARDAARLDVLLLLLPVDGAPARRLPDYEAWQTLHGHHPARAGEVRVTVLPSGCAGVLGYCKAGASAFELLSLSGRLLKQALALRPEARRIGLLSEPGGPAARRRAWQEALHAAASAHAFALPSERRPKPGEPSPKRIVRIELFGATQVDVRRWQATADAGNLVRHLTALPPNVLNAAGYRRALSQLARRHGLSLRWYGEAALRRLGAGAFLAVSRGNASRDAGIAHLSYRPRGRRVPRPDVTLVGKGILFDTGGTNLKAHRSMLDMHTDMAGSAVALASLVALSRMKSSLAADAWLAISENSIGPKAYRPQEVVRAANGTTIQVIHSDAEGRMVLADALHLAARAKPKLLVDFATLTGACVYALTERFSGVFTNRDALAPTLQAAGHESGERVWHFPLSEDFDTDIESTTADVAQCAVEGKGDHILAARFLQRFVPDDTPWVHVDLSSALRRGGLAHVPTDITGFGVRFALSLLLDQDRKQA
jgi:leucyl aminopeptidase